MVNKYSRQEVMLITTMVEKLKEREPVLGRAKAEELLGTIIKQMELDDECKTILYKKLGWNLVQKNTNL